MVRIYSFRAKDIQTNTSIINCFATIFNIDVLKRKERVREKGTFEKFLKFQKLSMGLVKVKSSRFF